MHAQRLLAVAVLRNAIPARPGPPPLRMLAVPGNVDQLAKDFKAHADSITTSVAFTTSSINPSPFVEKSSEYMGMESTRSQDVHSGTAIVQQYLQDVEPCETGVEAQSHLTQLSSQCILLFRIILKALREKRSLGSEERQFMDISLERSYERLKMWSDENGMADGKLDAKLEESHDLQRDTLKYVVSIGQALTDRLVTILDADLGDAGYKSMDMLRFLTAAVTDGNSDTSSDPGFSDASVVSVNGVLEDLRVDTTCLLDLEPLFCSPISRIKTEPIAVLDTTRIKWSPHQPYSDKVSARFPMAADELVARLGRANYERYLRCQEQKATNELGAIPSHQTASSAPDGASSKFHDSGIGSSLPTTGSAYAETVMSYGADKGRRVRVPPLPDEAKKGLPFACVVCGKWVTIITNSAWKQHVYGDLEPWVCLEAGCTSATKTFPTRNDWISHISLDHGMGPEWRMIQCALCRDDVGPGKLPITRHFSDHLEEISLSALPVDCDFDDDFQESEHDIEGEDIETVERASDIQNVFKERMTPHEEALNKPPDQTSSEREIKLMKRLRKLEGIVEQLSGQIEVEAAENQPSSADSPGLIVESDNKASKGLSEATDEAVTQFLYIEDSEESSENPHPAGTAPDALTARTDSVGVASLSNDRSRTIDDARHTNLEAIAMLEHAQKHYGFPMMQSDGQRFYQPSLKMFHQALEEAQARQSIPNDAPQGSALSNQHSHPVPLPTIPGFIDTFGDFQAQCINRNPQSAEAFAGAVRDSDPAFHAYGPSTNAPFTMQSPAHAGHHHSHTTASYLSADPHHQVPTSSIPTQQRAASSAWNASDDQTLLQARARGQNWAEIQRIHFPSRTPNACRKRHERLMERKGQPIDESKQTALGVGDSASPTKKVDSNSANPRTRVRRHRREYPSSWGFDKGQLTMKKRVMAVFDEPRRLAKDDMMLPTARELADGRSDVTDLDSQTMKRAEGFLNATEEEKGIWVVDDPTEEDIKVMLDAQMK